VTANTNKTSDFEKVAGYPVWSGGQTALLRSVKDDIEQSRKITVIAINPEKVIRAADDPDLKDILLSADYLIPDGIGIVKASKKQRGAIKKRITGIDLMDGLCALAAQNSYRIFLLGAAEESVQGTKVFLEEKYPDLSICGVQNGYWQDDQKLLSDINETNPDIILVALGSPKQEMWIRENMKRLSACVYQGVGGSFDVFSGKVKRAPRWMQQIGLEWLYRLIFQPSRLRRQAKLLKFFRIAKESKNE